MAGRGKGSDGRLLKQNELNDEEDDADDAWHVAYNKHSTPSITENGDRKRHASNVSTAQRSVQSRIEDLELDDAGFIDQRPRFRPRINRKAFIGICVGVLLGVSAVVCVVVFYFRSSRIPDNYIIVVDAGSSTTKINVFRYRGDKVNGTGKIEQILLHECIYGPLADFWKTPEAVRAAWRPCFELAKEQVPADRWEKTEVYVGATAGVRQLKKAKPKIADHLLEEVRALINDTYSLSPEHVHVMILDGEEEAALGWATVNFVMKRLLSENDTLSEKSHETYGALDLGGSSTQIAFATDDSNISANFKLTFFGVEYRLYSKSFSCRGKALAHQLVKARLVVDQSVINRKTIPYPCYPSGSVSSETHQMLFRSHCTKFLEDQKFYHREVYLLEGTGNVTQCRQLIAELFDPAKCPIPDLDCSHTGRLKHMNLTGPFMGFAGFVFTMDFYNLTQESKPGNPSSIKASEFRDAFKQHCEVPGKSDYFVKSTNKFIKGYCFDGIYIDILLSDVYGFSDHDFEKIEFRGSVNNISTSWAVGLALNSTNAVPPEEVFEIMSKTFFLAFLLIFAVFLILAISFLCRGVRRSCRDTSI